MRWALAFTTESASGIVSAQVLTLARGTLYSMAVAKLKINVLLIAAICLSVTMAGGLSGRPGEQSPKRDLDALPTQSVDEVMSRSTKKMDVKHVLQAPSNATLDELWSDLASADAGKAYRAIWTLRQKPAEAVGHIAMNLRPIANPDAAQIERLLTDLGSNSFVARDKADAALHALGSVVEPAARQALQASPPLETRRRLETLLGKLTGRISLPDELRQVRAVEILEYVNTAKANALIEEYAAGSPAARLTQESRAARERLVKSPSRVPAPATNGVDLYGDPLPRGTVGRLGTIRFRRDFEASFGRLSAFAFLPDGKSVLSAGGQHVRVWDIATGRLTHKLRAGPIGGSSSYSGASFALSRDASRLAVSIIYWLNDSQLRDAETRVYAYPSGQLLQTFPRDTSATDQSLAFSPDGKFLFSIRSRDAVVHIEDVATGKEVAHREFPGGNGAALSISNDGKHLAVATSPNSSNLFLWNWRDKLEPRKLAIDDFMLNQNSFSPDGKLLAGVSHGRLFVWDVSADRLLYYQRCPDKETTYSETPAFTPDGKSMLIATNPQHGGRKIYLLEPSTDKSQGHIDVADSFPASAHWQSHFLAISPDSQTLAASVGTGVRLFDLPSRKEISTQNESHDDPPMQFARMPDGDLVTAGDDGQVRIWNSDTMKLQRKWTIHAWVRALAVSPDGRLIAASGLNDIVYVLDVASGKEVYQLKGHGSLGGNRSLGFLPDGQGLVSFGDDFLLRVWDMKTGTTRFEHPIRPDGKNIPDKNRNRATWEHIEHAASLTPDGKVLVVAMGGRIHRFDTATGRQLMTIDGGGYLGRLAISPNGRFLLSRSTVRDGHELSIIDLSSGFLRQHSLLPGRWGGGIAFSPDNRMFSNLAPLSDEEAEITVYETASGKKRGAIRGFPGRIWGLAFLPDNRRLALSVTDGTVLLYDLMTLEPIADGQ